MSSRSRSVTAYLVALVVAGLAVAIGAIGFAASDQAVRVSDDAIVLRHAEGVLGASTALRSNVGITLVLASAVAEGLPVQETPEAARAASMMSLSHLEGSAAELSDATGEDIDVLLDEVRSELERALMRLANPADADALARSGFLPALDEMDAVVASLAADAAARIEAESGVAGRAAFLSSLTVGLLIPIIAVALVRSQSRRRAERALLSAELETSRQLSKARDEMISGLSHELRTPLTGIFGFAEALRDQVGDGPADPAFVVEATETIYREAGELRRMVDDLLVAARDGIGDLEYHLTELDVEPEIAAAIESFRKRGDAVSVALDPARILSDRFRLQHALRNVIANAIQHGGDDVAIHGRAVGPIYRVAISDAGPGIPDEVAERMFERYVHRGSVATDDESLGLGLSVARTLVSGMGGVIGYRRVENRTVFTIEIPMATQERPVPVV